MFFLPSIYKKGFHIPDSIWSSRKSIPELHRPSWSCVTSINNIRWWENLTSFFFKKWKETCACTWERVTVEKKKNPQRRQKRRRLMLQKEKESEERQLKSRDTKTESFLLRKEMVISRLPFLSPLLFQLKLQQSSLLSNCTNSPTKSFSQSNQFHKAVLRPLNTFSKQFKRSPIFIFFFITYMDYNLYRAHICLECVVNIVLICWMFSKVIK